MDDAVHDRLKDMIRDVGAESFAEAQGYGSTLEHWYVVLHGKKQGETIDDFGNGDPCSFTSMIMNKDDDVIDDVQLVRKFTYEHSTHYV